MTEIFITDNQTKIQVKHILVFFNANKPELQINFDLNGTDSQFPCGHTILRFEGEPFEQQKVLFDLQNLGYKCKILDDKICI